MALPQGPYRDSAFCAEQRLGYINHSYSIAEKPPGPRGDALRREEFPYGFKPARDVRRTLMAEKRDIHAQTTAHIIEAEFALEDISELTE